MSYCRICLSFGTLAAPLRCVLLNGHQWRVCQLCARTGLNADGSLSSIAAVIQQLPSQEVSPWLKPMV